MCFFTSCYHQPHQSLHSLEFSKSISLLSFALKQIHRFLFCLLLFCSAIASNIWGSCVYIWFLVAWRKTLKSVILIRIYQFTLRGSLWSKSEFWTIGNVFFAAAAFQPSTQYECVGASPPFSNNFFFSFSVCVTVFYVCEWMCMCRIKLKLQTLTDTLCSFCCCISIVAVKYAIFR